MREDFWQQGGLLAAVSALVIVPLLVVKRAHSGVVKLRAATISLTVAAFLSIVWITCFEKAGRQKSIEAFGQQPIGIPLLIFLPLMVLILGIPFPFFVQNLLAELFIEARILDPTELPNGWKRGLATAKWILGYFILLIAAWIVYCEYRAI